MSYRGSIGKRKLALLLVLLMCLNLFLVSAFAEEPETDNSQSISLEERMLAEATVEPFDEDAAYDDSSDESLTYNQISGAKETVTNKEETLEEGTQNNQILEDGDEIPSLAETEMLEEQPENDSLVVEEEEDLVLEIVMEEEAVSDISRDAIASSGTCGENLTWVLDDKGTLTISGTGAMTNYFWTNQTPPTRPWEDFRDSITELVVNNGVTALGAVAFYRMNNLQRVVLPEGITSLPHQVFCNCGNLTDINFPSSLTTLENECLWGTGIGTLTIPETVTNVDGHFYGGAWGAESKRLETAPNHPVFTAIDGVLFTKDLKTLVMYPCCDQVSYTVPAGTTAIRRHAFAYNFKLETLHIPATVSFIGAFAFRSNPGESMMTPLHDIYFGGTKNTWREALEDPTYDEYTLQHVTVHCADGDIFPNGEESGPHKDEWVKINGVWYYYDASGKILKNGWAKDSGGWCWLGADGKQVENKWIKSGGAWYYINGSGHRIENGWAKDSGGWCWLGSDGKQVENKWIKSGGAWYYINGSGHRIENGWAKDSGGWCWLGSDGKQIESQWIETGGKKYYIDANGHRVTGKQTINGKNYTFDSNGVFVA